MLRVFGFLFCVVMISSCAISSVNTKNDNRQTIELNASSSEEGIRFDCITNNKLDSCKTWYKTQKKIHYPNQPRVLAERLCPEVDLKACIFLASQDDVTLEDKIKLLGFACAGKYKTVCKQKEVLVNQLNAETKKKKNEERVENERIAKLKQIEEAERLAEEIAEKKRIEIENRRKSQITKLENQCDEKKIESCLKLAAVLESEDSEKAFQVFKNACEFGHTQTCKLIAKSALKNNDTDLAIFAYSTLCEKEYKNSCSTLIELRRMKSEQDDRKELMAYQVRQAEEARLDRIRAQEAQAEANRRAAAIQMINGIQKSFQPKPVVRCNSKRSFMGVETVCEESPF